MALLARLLPSQCHICRAWPAPPICAGCLACFVRLEPRCLTCAAPLAGSAAQCGECLLRPPPMSRTFAALSYGWPWDGLLAQFKFQQQTGLAAPLAAMLLQTPGVAQAVAEADAAVPVPASRQRLAARGYNPALLLARALGARRVVADALLRPHDAPPQRSLSRAQRLRRVQNAFVPNPARRPALHGRHGLLIDDVMTTGATLRAAAEALLRAGARQVSAAVLARTPPL